MSFQKNIWFGFIAALAIIAWLAVIAYRNNKGTRESLAEVAHTNQVLYHSERILSLIVDVEAGQRGYSLTGVEDFLAPAYDAIKKVNEHAASLGTLTSDNDDQVERIARLKQLVTEKLLLTNRAINSRKLGGVDEAREIDAMMQGKALTDQIKNLINEIQTEEEKLLQHRTEAVQVRSERFNSYFMAMLVATGLIILLLFYAIFKNTRARERVQTSLQEALRNVEDIYNNAPVGYYSTNADGIFIEINKTFLDWLQYTRDEVVGKMRFRDLLNEDSRKRHSGIFEKFKQQGSLRDVTFDAVRKDGSAFNILVNATAQYDANQQFIMSRSTVLDYTEQYRAHQKIEQLNHELESFSYSVSHDLRAPLRSIHGYTQILTEDYAPKLDEEGQRLLNVVVNNAQRMAKLIDDLLDFSRVSRKDIASSRVNTESLVQSIISELRPFEPGRNIDIQLHSLDPCDGDPNLLRQVWFNLLSNAFKYTRKKQQASIEIFSESTATESVYCVRDNGTGFNMQYADKLFGVFQRLHRQNEFEGTGVGLAIVQRIITRHGGSVWAVGEVDKGATFYFSLPKIPAANG
jgi:PAS domain S-box-containing protein